MARPAEPTTAASGNPPVPADAAIDEAAVVAAYSRWAPVYDAVFGLQTMPGRRAVAKAINRLPPGRILEAGVGTGLSLPAYRRDHRIVGIDLSPDMLERARIRVERRNLTNVEALLEMDAGHLAFADASFDAVAAMYVMTVVPHPEEVMAEFARVTRRGGRLAVVGHFASDRGIYRAVENRLSRFAARIGWNPEFPVTRLTASHDFRLIESRRLAPAKLWSLLLFERV
jgi:phosphatidylethanolamine/phosphatidyl-N-methylethanolamine N-methyltransferase